MAQYVSPEHYLTEVQELVKWMSIVYAMKPRNFRDCWHGAENPQFEADWTAREAADIKHTQEPWLEWAAEKMKWLSEVELAI
ncbi:MAG: hypothetical protein JSS66_05745 [Armatimonadetes bacterium]|nr:hypothetical protein [Armatimonadota bacterium]